MEHFAWFFANFDRRQKRKLGGFQLGHVTCQVLHPGKFQLRCHQKGNYDRRGIPGFPGQLGREPSITDVKIAGAKPPVEFGQIAYVMLVNTSHA